MTHFTLLTKKPAPTFAQTSLSLSNTSTVSNISAPQNPSITAAVFGASSTPNLYASSSSTGPASTFAFPSPAPATTSTCNHGLFGCTPSVAQTGTPNAVQTTTSSSGSTTPLPLEVSATYKQLYQFFLQSKVFILLPKDSWRHYTSVQ